MIVGPTNLNPRRFSSFEIVMERGVCAGTGPVFWIGLPPARSQTHAPKPVPAFFISRKTRAPWMVASILARLRMIPGFCNNRSMSASWNFYLGRVEVAEGLAEGFAFAEDRDPGEAGLKTLEHQQFP